VTAIEPLAGTDESRWESWTGPQSPTTWPRVDLERLARRRVVVLAAHPDDEVLGVGGLLARLASIGADLTLVWATDGEASHPGSAAEPVRRMPAIRRAESAAAADVLGLEAAGRIHLALPDGDLPQRVSEVAGALHVLLGRDDVLLAPWSGDGHPDHEACGRAARTVAGRPGGITVLEYPVWAWNWAEPGDDRVPWRDAWRVDLGAGARARKAAAVACFRSQVEAIGPADVDGPVLPGRVLAHFRRDYEVVLGAVPS
jgi:LmbE family N-acetylglucosaminyl deacetylase